MKPVHWLTIDQFSAQAKALRSVFEERFADPLNATEKRFVWDYWHVPDQYTLVRTPAQNYFPKPLFENVVSELIDFGQSVLGCQSISPPWLSYYVDGCNQELHSDVPHGPWAYVLSLCPSKKTFEGGETLILKPEVLDFWRSFDFDRGYEKKDFTQLIAPKFNRLTVFDPRLPHGVSPVKGSHDPREARLVLHGWFTEPRPFAEGSLKPSQITAPLNRFLETLLEETPKTLHGTLCFRLEIAPNGHVKSFEVLTHTLLSRTGKQKEVTEYLHTVMNQSRVIEFPKSRGLSQITVPITFK